MDHVHSKGMITDCHKPFRKYKYSKSLGVIKLRNIVEVFISDNMKLHGGEILWWLAFLEFIPQLPCQSTATRKSGAGKVEKSLDVQKAVVEEAGVRHTEVFLLRYTQCRIKT